MFSDPNNDNAPTKDDNNMGLISESKMRSSKYIPVSLQITIPFNSFETSGF
jgi:hypothetical protein